METLHPRAIELGLERVRTVCTRMHLDKPAFTIVTVAGTNGKGSIVAMLEAMLAAAGYKVGAYTSPHLVNYNERVRIAAQPVSDAALCEAFTQVEEKRAQTSLTYFEFGTLAAVELFQRAEVDIALLEVGLGGRLDAVNLWDAEVAVLAAIGIDHTDWLGPDRESIGKEKAGIFRPGQSAVCGDPDPPASVLAAAQERNTRLYQIKQDFDFTPEAGGWRWQGPQRTRSGLPFPALRGAYQLYNAASALMVLELLAPRFPVNQGNVRAGLLNVALPGRFQTLPGQPTRVLDVAHNPQAAKALLDTLRTQPVSGRTLAVVGMLKDKPLAEVLGVLAPVVDRWHLASLSVERGASATQLRAALDSAGVSAPITEYDAITSAYVAACAEAKPNDRIIVFGSFHTVGAILRQP